MAGFTRKKWPSLFYGSEYYKGRGSFSGHPKWLTQALPSYQSICLFKRKNLVSVSVIFKLLLRLAHCGITCIITAPARPAKRRVVVLVGAIVVRLQSVLHKGPTRRKRWVSQVRLLLLYCIQIILNLLWLLALARLLFRHRLLLLVVLWIWYTPLNLFRIVLVFSIAFLALDSHILRHFLRRLLVETLSVGRRLERGSRGTLSVLRFCFFPLRTSYNVEIALFVLVD